MQIAMFMALLPLKGHAMDKELKAAGYILTSLSELDPAARKRVWDWVSAKVDGLPEEPAQPRAARKSSESVDQSADVVAPVQ